MLLMNVPLTTLNLCRETATLLDMILKRAKKNDGTHDDVFFAGCGVGCKALVLVSVGDKHREQRVAGQWSAVLHKPLALRIACGMHAVAQQQFCVAQHFVTGVHLQSASFVNQNEAAQVL